MKYFTVIIQTAKDDTTSQTVNAYETKDAAEAAFHKELGYAMGVKTLKADLALVIDEDGAMHDEIVWKNTDTEQTDTTATA